MALAIVPLMEHSAVLADVPDRERLIYVFAPAENDPRLVALAADRAALACELANRHVVVQVIAGADSLHDESLRRVHDVPVQDFVALLVGKDGGEKSRSTGSVDLAAMLRLIDTMPMRRAEADEDLDCAGPAPRGSGL